jgi:hypothetical protein
MGIRNAEHRSQQASKRRGRVPRRNSNKRSGRRFVGVREPTRRDTFRDTPTLTKPPAATVLPGRLCCIGRVCCSSSGTGLAHPGTGLLHRPHDFERSSRDGSASPPPTRFRTVIPGRVCFAKPLGVRVEDILGDQPLEQRRPGPVGKLQRIFEQAVSLPRRQQDLVARFVATLIEQQRKAS